jgi:hypothetical protein
MEGTQKVFGKLSSSPKVLFEETRAILSPATFHWVCIFTIEKQDKTKPFFEKLFAKKDVEG